MARIDLHTHSTASDGSFSPADLVRKAKDAGLAALALTDHDTLSGLAEAEEAAGKDLEFIRGCEVSVTTPVGSMHILGLWLPRDSTPLENFLETQRERRRVRNELIIAKLNAMGVNMNMEEVRAHATSSVGRLHMALALLDKGYISTISEAFSKYIGDNGPAYVPKPYMDPSETIKLMHNLGATVAIAHPLLERPPLDVLEQLTRDWKKAGLSALEAWHSRQDAKQTEILIDLAKKYDLGLTGGSDFHGLAKPGIELGAGTGNLNVSTDVLDKLKERRRREGLPC